MGATGILPDLAHFRSLSADLGTELSEITGRLARDLVSVGSTPDAAREFNCNSSHQVGALLYTRFNLPELKRTPGGDPSTNDKILEALEKAPGLDSTVRRLISTIREYREIYKLKHTFVDQIPEFVNRYPFDGRIHATFRITRVVSGRLAASDPNLLAMPKHGKFAKRFRAGFVCGDGHVLGSWDLSQAELRVLAHLSQDPVLLDAYRTGKDLHATLAERIFGIPPKDQDESKHRLPAKAVNFGIPMGMTNIGLCVELKKNGVDIDEEDAQRWLDETMALYREVPTYQQHKIAEAKRNGFVTDLIGRRRYVGGIRSRDLATRAEAERFAFSTPIQAGAQAIMKVAEAYVWKEIVLKRQDAGQWIEPLIQIHDDLLLEFDARLIPEVNAEMQYAMTQTFKGLSVPIRTDGSTGLTWGQMTKLPAAALFN
jgi:DNA polymerase-1